MKKLLSLLLATTLLVGMVLPTAAKGNPRGKIGSITSDAFHDRLGNPSTHPEKTRPGDEIIIPLQADGFWDHNGVQIHDWSSNPQMGPTVSQLKANKVVPRLQISNGEEFIRDVSFVKFTPTSRNQAQAAVRIRFVEQLDISEEHDYRFTLYLSLDGVRTDASTYYSGMIRNDIYDVANLDYIYIGDGALADCTKESMNLELDLGNGVSIYRDMFPGERFYGRASFESNFGQDTILEAYPEITMVYNVKTIHVKFNGRVVQLTEELKNPIEYFVYDMEGKYVGTSREKLPFSERYYLSPKEITIDEKYVTPVEYTPDEIHMGAALTRFIKGVDADTQVSK